LSDDIGQVTEIIYSHDVRKNIACKL
jgi:hypothetical protein